jgi:DNA-binding MarR family transcriptional regulator
MLSVVAALKSLQISWRQEFINLSQVESDVFLVIATKPGVSSNEIQDELNLDQPHTSRVLKRLKAKNYVRALTPKAGDRKKAYYLQARKGAIKLLTWIDNLIDNVLLGNPTVLARLVAALETAPSGVIETLELALAKAKQQKLKASQQLQMREYKLSDRNRADREYRKMLLR